MNIVIAVLELRGGWPAWCEVGGFRTWSHVQAFCCRCNLSLRSLRHFDRITITEGPWHEWSDQDHNAEVTRCKRTVVFSNEIDRDTVRGALVYSKKMRGRGLCRDLPHLGLREGDMLDPSPTLLDVNSFDSLPLPVVADCWRITNRDDLIHETPILGTPGVGVGSWVVD